MRRKLEKWIKSFIILGLCVLLSGCGDLPADIQKSLESSYEFRIEGNREIAKELHDSGIITDDTFDSIMKHLDSVQKSVINDIKDEKLALNLLKACVGWRCVDKDTKNNANLTSDELITNYINEYGEANKRAKANAPILGGNDGNIVPIEIISESLIDSLNTQLGVEVYVLKTNIDSAVGIDEIVEAVKKAAEEKSPASLANYFEKAYYTNDKGVKVAMTLLDITNPDEQIVKPTSGAPSAKDPYKVSNTHDIDYTGTTDFNGISSDDAALKKPGTDLVIKRGDYDLLAMRLVEFNSAAVENLRNKIGIGEKRYLVLNGEAYLMEYPVGYVSGFVENDSRNEFEAKIRRSLLSFNFLTAEFKKAQPDKDGNPTNNTVAILDEDPYITYNGAKGNTDKSKASLVIYGNTNIDIPVEKDECNPSWDITFGTYKSGSKTKNRVMNTGRLVLRDYLEVTYAPEVVANEQIVALGRKLRIEKFKGSKNDYVARFYGKDGSLIGDDSAKLYINHFADADSLIADNKVSYISKAKDKIDDSDLRSKKQTTASRPLQTTGKNKNKNKNKGSSTTIKEKLNKIDSLDWRVWSYVDCTTTFPGNHMGVSDINYTDSKPLFYGMIVNANMFETGLFSGWIQSSDATKNSTSWWNLWLGEHGFNYKINSDLLVTYLKGNYSADLNKEGVMILDLQTISKIQEGYTKENKSNTTKYIRTMFMILGYLLIVYSIILLVAWNVDVNIDLGFNILEKLSFGRWVAIKSSDEMPYVNNDSTAYINFGGLVVSCITIACIGVVLIMVDIVGLVMMIIQLFGGIAKYITRMIWGS